jgi:hypothetical protein
MSVTQNTESNTFNKTIVEGEKVERPSSPLTKDSKDFLESLAKAVQAHNAVTVEEIGDGIIVRQGHPTEEEEDEDSISSKKSLEEVKEREARELSVIVDQARDKLLFHKHIENEFETLKGAIFCGNVQTDENGYLHDLEEEGTGFRKSRTTKDLQFSKIREFVRTKGKNKWGVKFPLPWFCPSTGGFPESFYCESEKGPWISNPKEVAIRFFRYVQDNYPIFNEQVSCFKVLNVKEGVVCNSWKLKGEMCPALTVEFTFKK